jgi:hypothetical protein
MIYKYCDSFTATRILESNFLKFSRPNEFNDPYDVHISVKDYSVEDFYKLYDTKGKIQRLYDRLKNANNLSTIDEFIGKLGNENYRSAILHSDAKQIQDWIDNFQNEISKVFMISCFSESSEEILMWAHYSDSFKGCIIVFDFESDQNIIDHTYSVKYRKKPVCINAKYCYGYQDKKIIMNALTTKYIDWKYEKEIRLIFPQDGLSQKNINDTTIWGISNCSKYIKGFIIGNRFSDKNLAKIIHKYIKDENVFLKWGRLKSKEYKVITMDKIE